MTDTRLQCLECNGNGTDEWGGTCIGCGGQGRQPFRKWGKEADEAMTYDEKKIAEIENRVTRRSGRITMSEEDFKTLLNSRLAWKFTAKCFAETAKDDQ